MVQTRSAKLDKRIAKLKENFYVKFNDPKERTLLHLIVGSGKITNFGKTTQNNMKVFIQNVLAEIKEKMKKYFWNNFLSKKRR